MSRLKGADLGIVVPSAPLNYRGDWSAAANPAYAANDTARKNGLLYLAMAAPPSSSDPSAQQTYVPSPTALGAIGGTVGGNSANVTSRAQPFTTTAAGTTLTGVQLNFGVIPNGVTQLRVGIATAIGANDGAVTWLGTPALISSPSVTGAFTVALPAALTLAGPTQYFLVVQSTVAPSTLGLSYTTAPSYSGVIASGAAPSHTQGAIGSVWAADGAYVLFTLISGSPTPYWQSFGPAAPLNLRAEWSATPSTPYAPYDVVTRNGIAYVANITPAAVDPASGAQTLASAAVVGSAATNAVTGTIAASFAQAFTPTSAMTVSAIDLPFQAAPSNELVVRVGIATAIGANDSTITWLGATPPTTTPPTAAGTVRFFLPASVNLASGTQYYVVWQLVGGTGTSKSNLTTNGSVSTPTSLTLGTANNTPAGGTGVAWVGNGTGTLIFTLYNGTIQSYWQQLAIPPSTTMNFRGSWYAAQAYAVNDLVLRNNLPYVAASTPNGADPATLSVVAAQTNIVGGLVGARAAQAFKVTVPLTIAQVRMPVAATTAGGKTVGIASAITGGVATYLGSGTSHATVSGGTDTIVLNTPVTLAANTTYYFVTEETNSFCDTPSAIVGPLSLTTGAVFGPTFGSSITQHLAFELDQLGSPSPWTPLVPTANVNTVAASGAAVTLPDFPTATMHRVTLTANTTITVPAPAAGKSFTAELVQDATGTRTVAWATPSGSITWPGGTVPVVSTAANAVDLFAFTCIDGTRWRATRTAAAFA